MLIKLSGRTTKKKSVEEVISDVDNGDDSDYVGDSVNGNDSESTPPSRYVTASKLQVYNGTSNAIVLRRCTVHNRYARLNCHYMRGGVNCDEVICDMCLYSRQMTVSKYPLLQPISHLVCNHHFKKERIKTQGLKDLSTIQVEGNMDIDPELLEGNVCPYCTTNRQENREQPKVCTICLIVFCVFTYFCNPLLRI